MRTKNPNLQNYENKKHLVMGIARDNGSIFV